jgi:hypothetical protein
VSPSAVRSTAGEAGRPGPRPAACVDSARAQTQRALAEPEDADAEPESNSRSSGSSPRGSRAGEPKRATRKRTTARTEVHLAPTAEVDGDVALGLELDLVLEHAVLGSVHVGRRRRPLGRHERLERLGRAARRTADESMAGDGLR